MDTRIFGRRTAGLVMIIASVRGFVRGWEVVGYPLLVPLGFGRAMEAWRLLFSSRGKRVCPVTDGGRDGAVLGLLFFPQVRFR